MTTGALPAGLSLYDDRRHHRHADGDGTAAFTVTVTDAATHTATKSLSITVSPAGTLTILTTSLPNAINGTALQRDPELRLAGRCRTPPRSGL